MKPDMSLEEIGQLVSRLKLGQIRLLEAHGKLGTITAGKLPDNAHQEMNLNTTLDKKKKSIQVIATYNVTAAYEPSESIQEDAPIFVRGKFLLQYEYTGDGQLDRLIKAMQATAIMNSWPFWRELVHSLTVRMGVPPFPVPLVNLSELVDQGVTKPKPVTRKLAAKAARQR